MEFICVGRHLFDMKRFLVFLVICSFYFSLCAQELELPGITTTIRRSRSLQTVSLDETSLSSFSSVEQALESAGLSFKRGNNELTFHGYWNSSIKVYINNVLMNDPNTGKFDFSTLDFGTVKSIKINPAATNGSVAVYISTVSSDAGSVHACAELKTKSYLSSVNDSPSARAEFSVPLVFENGSSLLIHESFNVSRFENHFGYRSLDASYRPDFSASYTGYSKKYSGYERTLFNNSLLAEFSTQKFPGASFGLSSYASYSDANCGKTRGAYFTEENQKNLSLVFALPVFLPFSSWSLKLLPSYKYSDLDYKKHARFYDSGNDYKINNFSFQAESTALGFLDFYTLCSYDFSDETSSGAVEKKYSHSLFSVFFSPSVKFSRWNWDFSFSLPADYFEPANELSLLYSFSAEKKFQRLAFFFSASKNITNPVFQQLYYSGEGGSGNPDLKSESAYSFYTGISYLQEIEASVKPFLIFYKDKIGWVSGSGGSWIPDNWGSSVNWGADFYFSTRELFENFSVSAGYTFCRAALTSGGGTDGNQIMYTPVHSFSLTGKYSFFNSIELSAVFSYNSRKYTSNSNTLYVPDCFNLDVGVSWSGRKLYARLVWQNVFDFQYAHVDGYPSPGTSFTASAGIKL